MGNLVEGNANSPDARFYGDIQAYARHLLGYAPQPLDRFHAAPSALEHFETSIRDPAFYQIYKKIILYFQKYKFNLHPYEEKELYFPGVQVKNVEFDRLITYFDYFYSDLSQAVFVTHEEFEQEHPPFHVRARQYRLNYKPFSYKVHVTSDKDQEAVVRVFIGPKYDEYGRHINISENRVNFVQFDVYQYTLKSGENTIERNSHQFPFYHDDHTSYFDLYKQVLGGATETSVHDYEAFFGVPRR